MNILLTGGGTGGHLAIAKALMESLASKNQSLFFIGSQRGQDRSWFEHEEGFKRRFFLETQGVVNQRGIAKIRSLSSQFQAMLEARKILKNHQIKRVVSVGGYSAAPASLAALSLGIPLYIHEQNAKVGLLNRLLKPFSRAFLSSYDSNSLIRDYPVRDAFFEVARVRSRVKKILFLGGSQGAKAINDWALELAPLIHQRGIAITHQCGEVDYERMKRGYEERSIPVELFAFDRAIHQKMQQADLAISRAGASSLWELGANGLPALFIPYPFAAGDHQYYNAKFILDQGLGWMVRQENLSTEVLLEILEEDLSQKSECLMAYVKRGAADRMADFILS